MLMVSFTVSREDFKLYFTCPRKLALKTLGVKVREIKRSPRLAPSYAIGLSGEKLTEEILEIIASLQVDESKGEYVEVFGERNIRIEKNIKDTVERLRNISGKSLNYEEVGEYLKDNTMDISSTIIEPTIMEAFKETSNQVAEKYKKKLMEETKKKFLNVFKELLRIIPKIEVVYKPTLRNRDTCSLGFPDYQVETPEGHVLIEVKNLKDLGRALNEGRGDLLFYNSLIADLKLGDSISHFGKLPTPVKSLIVIPRKGVVKEVREKIPSFRKIAVEIWKIKRAALIDHVLPDINPVQSICKRCQYKKFCEKGKIENLELAKPIPLIYSIAEYETKDKKINLKMPPNFWRTYSKLRIKAKAGDKKAVTALSKMDEYIKWFESMSEKRRLETLYKAMPNEFDQWGGLKFLKEQYQRIAYISHRLYSLYEEDIEIVLRVAKKRWNI